MEKKVDFKIIWKHFASESTLGKHLKAKSDFSLPYFLAGEELNRFEAKEQVSLTEFHLIKGLLVGYFDKPPDTDTSFARSNAKTIIADNLSTFKAKSIESLIIDLSNYLRVTFGQLVSLQSLMAGTELIPSSSPVKYDCCIDLINCLDDNFLPERQAGVEKLNQLLKKINHKELEPELVADYLQMLEIAKEFSGQ